MAFNTDFIDRFQYHLVDCDCRLCSNYLGKKRGCKLDKCPFEDIKQDAIRHGRIERQKGWNK